MTRHHHLDARVKTSYVLAVLLVPVVAPTTAAFSFSPDNGITGGDSDKSSTNPYCRFLGKNCDTDPSELPEEQQPECADGENNNGLWGADFSEEMWDGDSQFAGDPGCASPWDDTEASAWDTDLTASYRESFPGTPSVSDNPTVFHKGALKLGNDLADGAAAGGDDLSMSEPDTGSSGSAVEKHLLVSRSSLGDGRYSASGLDGKSSARTDLFSELPEGSVLTDTGPVEPPANPEDISGNAGVKGGRQTCGNGRYESSGGSPLFNSEIPSSDSGGNQPGEKSGTVSCREDFGALLAQPFHFDRSDDGGDYAGYASGDSYPTVFGKDGLTATDDEESIESETTGTPPDTSTSYSCEERSPSAPSSITSNDYWIKQGDTLTRKKVFDNGPYVTGEVNCGTDYEWQTVETINCNDYNRVSGGGRKQSTTPSLDRPANDRAGTYTDFKAYAESGSIETVWCGYNPDRVSTVDADGPQGRGDGFVVINDTENAPEGSAAIVGTRGPRPVGGIGDSPRDTVGQMVHTKDFGETLTRTRNYLKPGNQDWNTDCPRDLNYCVKYIDYYTSSQETVWEAPSNTENAVRATPTRTLSPDKSYSVCKFINMVHSNQVSGSDRELLDCDYETSRDEGSGDMSPLPESCGDVPDEHLIAGEGNQVDFGSLSERLYQSQACVSYGEDTADIDTAGNEGELTESACVMEGAAYAEGTTLNVADSGESNERNQASPDLEVCLDPDDSATPDITADRVEWDNSRNDQDSRDFGGEWYDLDNEKVQEYVKTNFQESDYPQNPVSRVETFIRTNPNPQHPQYNPTGGETGLTLEDDCGSDRFATGLRCEDETSKSDTNNLFYTFFDKVIAP